jgi:hypothetical protein
MKPRRRCKFCEIGQVTKEHVIPESWDSILDSGLKDLQGHTLWYVHRTYDPVGSGETVTLTAEKRAKTPAFISRNFCRSCQGGWMRELDESVRDLMTRLTPTTSICLDLGQQRRLARWVVKTMMVYITKETEKRQREFGVVADYPRRQVRLRGRAQRQHPFARDELQRRRHARHRLPGNGLDRVGLGHGARHAGGGLEGVRCTEQDNVNPGGRA